MKNEFMDLITPTESLYAQKYPLSVP